jgi:hypothetical protein
VSALLLGLLFAAIPIGLLQAQGSGRITGRVTDALTQDPIREAIVSVVGTAHSAGTDEDGFYVLEGIATGAVTLKAQILGYIPITTDEYTLPADSSLPVDFRLAPLMYELEGVEVTANSPSKGWTQRQGAQVLTKEQIPQRGDILSALGGLVPGVSVRGRRDNTRVVVRNAAADVLYVVDGQVIRPPLTFYIEAAAVDCVEVRKGYSAVAEYKPSVMGENYSGVVLIWTRGAIGARPAACVRGT